MKKIVGLIVIGLMFLLFLGLPVRAEEVTLNGEPDIPTINLSDRDNLSESSAERRSPVRLKSTLKRAYTSNEKIKIELFNRDVNLVELTLKNNKEESIKTEVVENDSQGVTTLTVNPPSEFKPGKYQLTVTDQTGQVIKQDFLWGVLAINPNKAIYKVNETADLAIAVLNEQGKMVCDANLKLRITNDQLQINDEISTNNGKIIVNPECNSKGVTLNPDYEAKYKLGDAGVYKLELTAVTANGTYTINDQIVVKNEVDFEVERISATRIFPSNAYPMTINVVANIDFSGNIYEIVPASFEIVQTDGNVVEENNNKKIVWKVDLKKGNKISLVYTYKAPSVSPQFYLTGPLTMATLMDLVYDEGRQWQIAADDLPASGFYFQTGYYVGNGNFNHITGLGFRPQMVVLKSNDASIATIFKNHVMPNNEVAYLGSATANSVAGFILLEDDGFTAASTAATANVRFTWTAFAGSDCTASGVFCTGAYTGNGSFPRTISTGFDPDLVWVKQSTAVAAGWKSSAMPALGSQYFQAAAGIGTTDYFTTLGGGVFGVGISTNVTGSVYHYAAFKNVAGAISVGSTIGIGNSMIVDSVGFTPDWMFLKNASIATTGAISNGNQYYGNSSSYFTATANLTNAITDLRENGFSLGINAAVSGLGNTLYWAAFKGETTPLSSSGTFKMTNGSYLGTGDPLAISNLTFSPNLVIVKGNTAQTGVFRTDQMAGNASAYLDNNVANLAGAITDLTDYGFNIGSSAVVNSVGVSYYWTAYGNAWRPGTRTGASDFFIGAYYGNGLDARNIIGLPYQPDLLAIKANRAIGGVFRTSDHIGDTSAFFAGTAEAANMIQSIGATGFQVGTADNVNRAAILNYFFGFKVGVGFTLGSYSGSGVTDRQVSVGFQPDYLWVKGIGGTRGVSWFTGLTGDAALPFIAIGSTTNVITGVNASGFTVGTAGESNKSGLIYRYAAWKNSEETPAVVQIMAQIMRHGMSLINGVRQRHQLWHR